MTKSEFQQILATLEKQWHDLCGKLDLAKLKLEVTALQEKINQPGFWDNPDEAQKISQQASQKETQLNRWQNLGDNLRDFSDMADSALEAELNEFVPELEVLQKQLKDIRTETLLDGEYDDHNAIVTLQVGNGGQDAEDFCKMLQRMYLRWAESQDYKAAILEESRSDDGLRSCQLSISGPMAYGFLRSEHGVHRLIRLSPFNAKSLRQTSFARVEVIPEIESETELTIDPNDLRIDVFRSGGAGGQSVNTTDSAVRITYLPLNLVVTCQNEKSQHQNKDSALKVLRSRLAQLKAEQQAAELNQLRGDMLENSFGSQIRTYTLQPYKLVKDHRTDYEENQPDRVFDGNLKGFIESYLGQ
ncbi:peptide chain release factor 2 [bacterium]|nr:peptide chain release factor 2 [bacterium]NCQ55664.1 peptide chain release factor 2 [Candidatus Parcubacteria bacterium]NCS67489.1 peptide chain release factor 2 [Candidatus Peregrinibacteria bacterium]NCS96215.1 peptide chain release factor 2 [bacterium]